MVNFLSLQAQVTRDRRVSIQGTSSSFRYICSSLVLPWSSIHAQYYRQSLLQGKEASERLRAVQEKMDVAASNGESIDHLKQ